ncbi:hypothetical protein T03_12839 [Trichinella britovi]|uniref:Uncharacterized protein n=1 Tax=Trichinella britovi TaxID=45882 RepID=A0A0V1C529_TRIBR|nr:hypothetical protein T03_12839 [Trichinella britovi]
MKLVFIPLTTLKLWRSLYRLPTHKEMSDDFLPCIAFPRIPNNMVNLISRYNFPVAPTSTLS